MKHEKSSVIVYQTNDYKRFRSIDGNRPINKKKVERIIAEIKSGNDVLNEVPVLVTDKSGHLELLDGQHRLEVAVQLKRPVHYIIHHKMNIYQVAKVNSNTERWKYRDFINSYIKAGNDNYVKLKKFIDQYKVAPNTAVALLHSGTNAKISSKDGVIQAFENGTFQVLKQKEARALMEICKNF